MVKRKERHVTEIPFLLFGFLFLLGENIGRSQGTINFNNAVVDGVYAPIFDVEVGSVPLRGTNFLAQLYIGAAGSAETDLKPVPEAPVQFLQGGASGFLNASPSAVRIISGIPPGSPAVAQIRAWTAVSGRSFEDARAIAEATKDFKHRFGVSKLVPLFGLGGYGNPPSPPAVLDGLKPFAIRPFPYRLNAMQTTTTLVLSWPASDTNYVLETITDLSQTNWVLVQAASEVQGEMRWTTNPLSGAQGFFRLKRF